MPVPPRSPPPAPRLASWEPPSPREVEARLRDHLRSWLGAWPPRQRVDVVTSPARGRPRWDGKPSTFVGVSRPGGAVLSVAAEALEKVGGPHSGRTLDEVAPRLLEALGFEEGTLSEGAFRWTARPALIPEVGSWVPSSDPRLAAWLRPFGGDVLAAFASDGKYAAGVGMKRHSDLCWELAVGTEEPYRGQRLARSLVAQAARRVLDDGRVPVYLHGLRNQASARVADAAGFPDRGWRIIGATPG